MKDSHVALSDGRRLAYAEIGAPDGVGVLFFHGAPMSRLHLGYLERRCVTAGIRVVSPDRPGYGGSSPRPGRSMADWAADVAALAGALGWDRFIVAGHSSGGPYAVACAALLPDRVLAGIVLGGVTDMGWPGAWEGCVDLECALMRLPDERAAIACCAERFGNDGSRFLSAADLEFAESDNALFADVEVGPLLLAAVVEAFRQGVVGYAQDMVVQGRPWPFRPDRIAAPFHVVHGEADVVLPLAHSRHTAELIPGARLHVLPGHGHITTVAELPRLASDLGRASRSGAFDRPIA